MNKAFFIKGLIIGFSIAAPVGPIGLLCIQRTLLRGKISGLISGLGAASADAIYGLIAALGLTALSEFLISQGVFLRLAGGIFLCYLGLKVFLSRPSGEAALIEPDKQHGLMKDYISTLLLTLTNPMTILSFAAIFTGIGMINTRGGYMSAVTIVLGVFSGSAIWWYLLATATDMIGKRFNISRFKRVNRISGAIIIGFGAAALIGLVRLNR